MPLALYQSQGDMAELAHLIVKLTEVLIQFVDVGTQHFHPLLRKGIDGKTVPVVQCLYPALLVP